MRPSVGAAQETDNSSEVRGWELFDITKEYETCRQTLPHRVPWFKCRHTFTSVDRSNRCTTSSARQWTGNALQQMEKGKLPGKDGLVAEMLQDADPILWEALAQRFSVHLEKLQISEH